MKSLFELLARFFGPRVQKPIAKREIAPPSAAAGDSLGVGAGQFGGKLPINRNAAVVGRRTMQCVLQLNTLPKGCTVLFSCGTNDAVAGLPQFSLAVDAVIETAKKNYQILVWAGPLKNSFAWDKYCALADDILKTKMAEAGFFFLSLRGVDWKPGERANDGYHLTPNGYVRMWTMAQEIVKQ